MDFGTALQTSPGEKVNSFQMNYKFFNLKNWKSKAVCPWIFSTLLKSILNIDL